MEGIESAQFDATGRRIVYVADDRGIVVRDLASGQEVRLGNAPKGTIWGAWFSPDGKRVAALPERGDVPVWRIDRPAAPEFHLKGHTGHVQWLDYTADGRMATGGADRTVRVWSPTGRQIAVMRGHEDEVTTVVFSDDGTRVLSTSDDGTLRLWDAQTGAQLAVLQSEEGKLKDVALSSDGKIATLDEGDMVRVYRCEICGSVDQVRALALSKSPRPLSEAEQRQFRAAAG